MKPGILHASCFSESSAGLAEPSPKPQLVRVGNMVKRPDGMNAFEFSVLSGLRAAQLQRGCAPRVPASPKVAVTAQHEVAERQVVRTTDLAPSGSEPGE